MRDKAGVRHSGYKSPPSGPGKVELESKQSPSQQTVIVFAQISNSEHLRQNFAGPIFVRMKSVFILVAFASLLAAAAPAENSGFSAVAQGELPLETPETMDIVGGKRAFTPDTFCPGCGADNPA
jgi:hypothetical protein